MNLELETTTRAIVDLGAITGTEVARIPPDSAGTDTIQSLIVGREITGAPAFTGCYRHTRLRVSSAVIEVCYGIRRPVSSGMRQAPNVRRADSV
jgi:hypothetical protein